MGNDCTEKEVLKKKPKKIVFDPIFFFEIASIMRKKSKTSRDSFELEY